jgi:hypothetical protein
MRTFTPDLCFTCGGAGIIEHRIDGELEDSWDCPDCTSAAVNADQDGQDSMTWAEFEKEMCQ